MKFRVTVLGSGFSLGVPVLGCRCLTCQDSSQKRLRTSLLLTFFPHDHEPIHVVVDTSPDFRTQMLALNLSHLDQIIYTHIHADHVGGFDDVRPFCYSSPTPKYLSCWMPSDFLDSFKERFSYVFEKNYHGSLPLIDVQTFRPNESFSILDGVFVETMKVPHGQTFSTALKIGSFVYATDFKSLPEVHRWKGKVTTMIAEGLDWDGVHRAHPSIPETLEWMDQLGVQEGWLTHLSHKVHTSDQNKLPTHVRLAWDGLTLEGELGGGPLDVKAISV